MPNDFDEACRRLVKESPLAFLPWLLTDFEQVARHVGWVDTRRLPFPGKADQTGDLVFELQAITQVQSLWALALEFQVEPDPDMFGRMLIYLGTLWMEKRPDTLRGSRYQLAACVVNLTGTSSAMPTSHRFTWPGSDELECRLVARERYLAEESAKATLEQIAHEGYDRAILPWIPPMAGGCDAAVIAQWLELAGGEPDERRRADLGYNALIFAEKSENPQAWQTALEGWGMIKSQTMEKTRAEGRVEGLVEGRHQTLLLILAARTNLAVPSELVNQIDQCEDIATLDAWTRIAATISTYDEFQAQTGI
jgi:hypothetical protein